MEAHTGTRPVPSKTQPSEGTSPSFPCSNRHHPQNSQQKRCSASSCPPFSSCSDPSLGERGTSHGSLQHGFCPCTRADTNTLHGSAEPSLQLYVASPLPNPFRLRILGEGSLKSTLTLQSGSNMFTSPLLKRTQYTSALS